MWAEMQLGKRLRMLEMGGGRAEWQSNENDSKKSLQSF